MILNGVEVMSGIESGLRGDQEMVVGHQDLASVMGNIGAEVLSSQRLRTDYQSEWQFL